MPPMSSQIKYFFSVMPNQDDQNTNIVFITLSDITGYVWTYLPF